LKLNSKREKFPTEKCINSEFINIYYCYYCCWFVKKIYKTIYRRYAKSILI